ncbi:hypothetical protein [Acrocarpospora sp. B8E8]|uniref:hypothetical protein n=1 Tax=Acrocarpospora sp. B8E8 TaxID=3153572 RepID=UPI00325D3492
MKRSEIRRVKPMKSGTSQLKRTPFKQGSGKAVRKASKRRRTGPPADVMALLAQRSGGLCEIGMVCLGNAPAVDPSHRIAKGMGGTKDPRSNTAANNLHACRADHDLVERDPAAAYANGWKIRRGVADPTQVPVRHWVHGWILLAEDGTWTSADPAREDLPVVESVALCLWCGQSVRGATDCTQCGAAQTADIGGSPSDLDAPF